MQGGAQDFGIVFRWGSRHFNFTMVLMLAYATYNIL